MLASVKVNDELISLNHSGKSIYFSTASVLMGHSFQDGSPVQVTVQLHADAETVARPQHFLRRLATKINLEASTTSYHVFLGESTLYGSATALNQKWQSKSAMEALVLPFLEVCHACVAVLILVRRSAHVLMTHQSLLLHPCLSAVCCLCSFTTACRWGRRSRLSMWPVSPSRASSSPQDCRR